MSSSSRLVSCSKPSSVLEVGFLQMLELWCPTYVVKDHIHLVVVDTPLDYQCQLYTSFHFPIRCFHDFDSVSGNLDILQVNLKFHLSRVSITSVWFE